MTVRLFLVAPDAIDETLLLECAKAASAAADCATILVPDSISQTAVTALQGLNLAVILKDAEVRKVHYLKADGLQLSAIEDMDEARKNLKTEVLGFVASASRHMAMEAAEAGADYVAFLPSKQVAGLPIVGWWQEVTDVPAVVLDAVSDATLRSQNPDFIRPSDEMWTNAEAAARVVKGLMEQWST
jgi:thiamine-phosphate pyrophosphorylase